MKLLKRLYVAGPEYPEWAELAYRRNWISFETWLNVKPWPDAKIVGRFDEVLYENNPFFAMLTGRGTVG